MSKEWRNYGATAIIMFIFTVTLLLCFVGFMEALGGGEGGETAAAIAALQSRRAVVWKTPKQKHLEQPQPQPGSKCNVYEGSWVYDDSYPMYDSTTSCPFIRKEFDCLKYGRSDRDYLRYRWQPNNCTLPRFDAKDFLTRMQGKKIMYIGDSLSLNNWQSLVCLLYAGIPKANLSWQTNTSINTVTFVDYQVSVILFHSLHLVDIKNEPMGRVMKLDSLDAGALWKTMDVLIFNSWLWWLVRGTRQQWDYIQEGEKISKDMDRLEAYHKAMLTWARWVDAEVDTTKTQVFFQGISPAHYNGAEWNKPGIRNCANETEPISGSSSLNLTPPTALSVIKEVLSSMKKHVSLLDITAMSQLRKDAHPSSHNGFKGMDCTHWCVAGVPDIWNQILYSELIA